MYLCGWPRPLPELPKSPGNGNVSHSLVSGYKIANIQLRHLLLSSRLLPQVQVLQEPVAFLLIHNSNKLHDVSCLFSPKPFDQTVLVVGGVLRNCPELLFLAAKVFPDLPQLRMHLAEHGVAPLKRPLLSTNFTSTPTRLNQALLSRPKPGGCLQCMLALALPSGWSSLMSASMSDFSPALRVARVTSAPRFFGASCPQPQRVQECCRCNYGFPACSCPCPVLTFPVRA